MPKLTLDQIEATTLKALTAHGANDWIAGQVADAVRVSESLGNKICGLYYLESYCQQLLTGRVNGQIDPAVTRPKPGIVSVDAKFGFAQPAFARALPDAITAAKECGVASLAVCHAHTCTSLGYFTSQIANAGFVGIGMTNASPIVAPPGGKTRVIGTNPMAFAVPAKQGGISMQFDQSTTTVALGKITMAKAAGEKIPEGWALDADGNPTTDPEAALAGSLVSMGGYKGWGFGLMAELLTAGMTGSKISRDVKPLKAPEGQPHDLGQYYLLIDPEGSGDFYARFASVLEGVAMDPESRMPGQNTVPATEVDVPDSLWELVSALAAYK